MIFIKCVAGAFLLELKRWYNKERNSPRVVAIRAKAKSMPIKEPLKTRIANYIFRIIKVYVRHFGCTIDEYIENEAERRSKHWREEKGEFARALQKMHDQNSANLNKVRDLEAIIANQPNKKQIFNEYLKQQVELGRTVPDQPLYVMENAAELDLVGVEGK